MQVLTLRLFFPVVEVFQLEDTEALLADCRLWDDWTCKKCVARAVVSRLQGSILMDGIRCIASQLKHLLSECHFKKKMYEFFYFFPKIC